jgi:Domain of unknown function (DUF4397)
MKNILIGRVVGRTLQILSFVALGVLGSCLEKGEDPVLAPVSYFTVYNACADSPDLDLHVDGKKINLVPFKYSLFSNSIPIDIGTHTISAVTTANDIVATASIDFLADQYYSLFLVNFLPDAEFLVVRNVVTNPAPGKAMVRFVHASTGFPACDVLMNTGVDLFVNNAYQQITSFKEIDATTLKFTIVESGTGEIVSEKVNYVVQAGGFYTLILQGTDAKRELVVIKEG